MYISGRLRPGALPLFVCVCVSICECNSFGDQHRAYLRGQLTIHKNDPKVNRIWKGCEHLRHYTDRLEV